MNSMNRKRQLKEFEKAIKKYKTKFDKLNYEIEELKRRITFAG